MQMTYYCEQDKMIYNWSNPGSKMLMLLATKIAQYKEKYDAEPNEEELADFVEIINYDVKNYILTPFTNENEL